MDRMKRRTTPLNMQDPLIPNVMSCHVTTQLPPILRMKRSPPICTLIIFQTALLIPLAASYDKMETNIAWYHGEDYHSDDTSGFQLEEFQTSEYEEPTIPEYQAGSYVILEVV